MQQNSTAMQTYLRKSIISRNFRFQLYLCARSYASRPLVPSSHRHCRDGGVHFWLAYLLSPIRVDGVGYTKGKSTTPHHHPEGDIRHRRCRYRRAKVARLAGGNSAMIEGGGPRGAGAIAGEKVVPGVPVP